MKTLKKIADAILSSEFIASSYEKINLGIQYADEKLEPADFVKNKILVAIGEPIYMGDELNLHAH